MFFLSKGQIILVSHKIFLCFNNMLPSPPPSWPFKTPLILVLNSLRFISWLYECINVSTHWQQVARRSDCFDPKIDFKNGLYNPENFFSDI